ncbi:MarR family winged helix-turn-helix transcriptional regulator [uncultured Paludibaculum sp.]|uniref:MarR family winged helix-turn-helix transcriptional regulator n=1 Tax=uncultured Paludibaculum sp. TaxID=1765020 RepID=UPI00374D4F97
MTARYEPAPRAVPPAGVAFLLSQVGAHAAQDFEERLGAVELKPHHAGLLRMLGANPGLSQQELCDLFGVFPSRLVVLLDQLEVRRLIQRRSNPSDRRGHRLHLTSAGRRALTRIGKLTQELEGDLCTSLSRGEREILASLLARIVAAQKITPAVHPAYRKLRGRVDRPDVAPSQPSAKGKRRA